MMCWSIGIRKALPKDLVVLKIKAAKLAEADEVLFWFSTRCECMTAQDEGAFRLQRPTLEGAYAGREVGWVLY
ncbi:hypothetical protein CRYUN_Cryun02cG0102200 [Craigia yunnanensis]